MKNNTKAYMIVDMQYGSTGKGLLAGVLAKKMAPDTLATAWSPNAGHTYIDENGRKYVHRMLANGIVSPSAKRVLIGAGSVVDVDHYIKEVELCIDIILEKEISFFFHPRAAVVTQEHRDKEAKYVKIGSTMKGSAAANIQKMNRDPDDMNIMSEHEEGARLIRAIRDMGAQAWCDEYFYADAMDESNLIQIEGAQGYSLSINNGLYPYVTSRDVTPHQIMADISLPYGTECEVIGTVRTYPIRVSNRSDKEGNEIGTSGGCYPDQREMKWSELGLEPETTTVTGLPRRIFTFSYRQMFDAIRMCNPDFLFVNFLNYIEEDKRGEYISFFQKWIHESGFKTKIRWVGEGANHGDVTEIVNVCIDSNIKSKVIVTPETGEQS